MTSTIKKIVGCWCVGRVGVRMPRDSWVRRRPRCTFKVRDRGLRRVPEELRAVVIPRGVALGNRLHAATRPRGSTSRESAHVRIGTRPIPEVRIPVRRRSGRPPSGSTPREEEPPGSPLDARARGPPAGAVWRSVPSARCLEGAVAAPRSATAPRPVHRWPARTTCWPRRQEDRGTGTARSTRPRGAFAHWVPSNGCCPRIYLQKMDTSHATEDFPGDSTGGGQTEDSLSSRCRASTGWARGPRPRSAPPGRPPSAAAGRGRAGRPGPRRSHRPARR